jgi:hypothetical protein
MTFDMDYRELLEKYNLLLSENKRLIKENDMLRVQLWIQKCKQSENRIAESTTEKNMLEDQPTDTAAFSQVNNASDSISKIKLFMSFFKGRDDVYAKKWENKKKAISAIFTRLFESMAGRIVRQAKDALFKMHQSALCRAR